MADAITYGKMNAHVVGIVMREAVSRAMSAIRQERFTFEVMEKEGYGEKMHDIVTSADRIAQMLYQKMLRECFPDFGIVAEENHLRIPCALPRKNIYFTVDPIDGTRAWARGQSHGISTMVSLVCNDEVVAVVIGDINTQELFYYRPASYNVWRVHNHGELVIPRRMQGSDKQPLSKRYLLLRERPDKLSAGAQRLAPLFTRNHLFKDWQMADGSIGISMARLWKQEVGAHLLSATVDTPWDLCPILGISKKLGFEFLKIDPTTGELSKLDLKPSDEVIERKYELLVVHADYVPGLLEYFERMRYGVVNINAVS